MDKKYTISKIVSQNKTNTYDELLGTYTINNYPQKGMINNTFNVSFVSNNQVFNSIKLRYDTGSNIDMKYDENEVWYQDIADSDTQKWTDNAYKTITITDVSKLTNRNDFEIWLKDNAKKSQLTIDYVDLSTYAHNAKIPEKLFNKLNDNKLNYVIYKNQIYLPNGDNSQRYPNANIQLNYTNIDYNYIDGTYIEPKNEKFILKRLTILKPYDGSEPILLVSNEKKVGSPMYLYNLRLADRTNLKDSFFTLISTLEREKVVILDNLCTQYPMLMPTNGVFIDYKNNINKSFCGIYINRTSIKLFEKPLDAFEYNFFEDIKPDDNFTIELVDNIKL